jgi:hypothetical protein
MLVILHLQLIINQVQIEIPPDLLQEEENEMVRLNLKLFSPTELQATICLQLKIKKLIMFFCDLYVPFIVNHF